MQKVPPPCLEHGVIRMCQERDYSVLEEIYKEQEGVNMPFDYFDEFQRAIRSGVYLVVEIGQEIVAGGGINYTEFDRRGSLFFGLVRQSMQRRGIGTALLFARIHLLPVAAGTFVSMQATQWSEPFYDGFGFQWYAEEKGHNGVTLKAGTLVIDPIKLEAIAGYFDKSNLQITCSSSDFDWSQARAEPLPEDLFIDKETPKFQVRGFTPSDRRFLGSMQRRISREQAKLRTWIYGTVILSLSAGTFIAVIEIWNLMFLLAPVVAICGLVLGSIWFDLSDKSKTVFNAAKTGQCRELQVRVKKIWKLASHEASYAFELVSPQVLFLRGRPYRKTGRFPCLDFSVVRYKSESGMLAYERICFLDKTSSPDFVILSPQINAILDMPHLTLINGSVETILRRLGEKPSETAEEKTSD